MGLCVRLLGWCEPTHCGDWSLSRRRKHQQWLFGNHGKYTQFLKAHSCQHVKCFSTRVKSYFTLQANLPFSRTQSGLDLTTRQSHTRRHSPNEIHLPPPQLHRRLLYDDVRGVGEPLNETSNIFPEGLVVRGRLLLSLERPTTAADMHRPLAEQEVLQPLLAFVDGDLSPKIRHEVRKNE